MPRSSPATQNPSDRLEVAGGKGRSSPRVRLDPVRSVMGWQAFAVSTVRRQGQVVTPGRGPQTKTQRHGKHTAAPYRGQTYCGPSESTLDGDGLRRLTTRWQMGMGHTER